MVIDPLEEIIDMFLMQINAIRSPEATMGEKPVRRSTWMAVVSLCLGIVAFLTSFLFIYVLAGEPGRTKIPDALPPCGRRGSVEVCPLS